MVTYGCGSESEPVLIPEASSYNECQRMQEVLGKFERLSKLIISENLHTKSTLEVTPGLWDTARLGTGEYSSGRIRRKSSHKDIITTQLDAIVAEVQTLEYKIKEFEGPHFTKMYRTMQGDCGKYQLDLDGLDITGRDDIRKKRREVIIQIEQLSKILSGKAHSDGRPCADCEVKD